MAEIDNEAAGDNPSAPPGELGEAAINAGTPGEDETAETAPGAFFSPKSAQALDTLARISKENALEQIRDAVFVAEYVTYIWTVEDDELHWSENLAEVLNGIDLESAKTGRGFASLLDRDNTVTRFDTVVGSKEIDAGDGVSYCIEYKVWPAGPGQGQPFWVEDTGRWYAGNAGKPAYAMGAMRIIDARRSRDEKLNYLSQCDPLTGFMNRGKLTMELDDVIKAADRSGESVGFVLAAIDNLDVVNDAYGFEIADHVISAVGKRLNSAMRGDDNIGRYAGNKFGMILRQCSEYDMSIAAERFLDVVRGAVIKSDKGPVWATISLGGCLLPKYAGTVQEAMVRAEEALADAKKRPTDCFVGYKPSKRRASVRERNVTCASEIVSALKENRFILAFQPIVDANTRKARLHEGLLRLLDENDAAISAGHLLPVAEKLGLIRLIDRRVLEMGVSTLEKNPELQLSLNISGITATDARWFEQIVDYIAEHQDVCERLTLEITETVALFDLEEIVRFIARLRELGCKVAIDDFGAGYTSFRNLQLLNVDMVKLDGSFCENLSESPDNQYFVRTLVDMANRFDLDVVAEWVQSEEDAALLQGWGVGLLQGNFFGEATHTPEWGGMGKPEPSGGHRIDPLSSEIGADDAGGGVKVMNASDGTRPEETANSPEKPEKHRSLTADLLLAPFRKPEKKQAKESSVKTGPEQAEEQPAPEAKPLDLDSLSEIPEDAPESLFISTRRRQIPGKDGDEPALPERPELPEEPSTSETELTEEPSTSETDPAEEATASPTTGELSEDKQELFEKLTRAFGSAGSLDPAKTDFT
ncbi:MAG: EAL domain-containing protein [Hyphomicrobiales bacterium]